ncbi:MAG: hypothetical protein ACOCTG_06140, partial [Bacteroidota bacterium]
FMSTDLSSHLHRISRDYRLLRAITAVQAMAALVALPLLALGSSIAGWLAAIIGGVFVVRKVRQSRRNDLLDKQIRYEARFFRQQMDERTLVQCLRRSEHLWDASCTLRGMRAVFTKPIPRLLPSSEKKALLRQRYRMAFRGLIPPRITPDVLVPVAGVAWIFQATFPAELSSGLLILGIVVAAMVLLELATIVVAHDIRTRFRGYENELFRWTLDRMHVADIVTPTTPTYRHEVLYRSEPMFAAGM